ncbi:MAG: CoB--CoM heterodisulfide reductase iron-sulfur subunit B family protein, partial [Candidatus Bathyarchaeota archaeon]|nr:CoB--CoM heterodisulfide reductase iron-sulfur subunit B family protein [Candidatus Bathyarchaeota archaeon]
YQYELSTRAIAPKLGIELVEIEGYSCCGVPLKGYNVVGWLYLAARNMALAESLGLDMLTLCNGCYNSFVEARHFLDTKPEVKAKINESLALEDLEYKGTQKTVHILEALRDHIDPETFKEKLEHPLDGLRVAPHYGCHSMRPSDLIDFVDSEDPQIMDDIIHALGATNSYYPEKLDCCGSTITAADYEASFKLTGAKIESLQKRNYDALVTVCPFCQKMYDGKQEAVKRITGDTNPLLPVFYLPQLIGVALGLDDEALGLNFNATPVDEFVEKVH